MEKTQYNRKQLKHVVVFDKIFEKLHGPYQSWKKQQNGYNPIKFNQFNYLFCNLIKIY